MKKLAILITVLALSLVAFPVLAAKPETPPGQACSTIQSGAIVDSVGDPVVIGYNEWGYNYQARVFNGMWCDYHPYYREGGGGYDWCQRTMSDVELMMKWSDEWISNKDCNGDTLLDRGYSCNPENANDSACLGAWLTNHERGSYKNVLGDWVISVDYNGTKYNHEMTIAEIDEDFNLVGSGGYPAGETYTTTWMLVNSYVGDEVVHLELDYDGSSYIATLDGVINPDGSMSGEWTSSTNQSGTWKTTSGLAETCEYNYFVKIVAVPDDAILINDYWYTSDNIEIGESIWGAFAITQTVSNDSCADEHGLQYKSPLSSGLGYYHP